MKVKNISCAIIYSAISILVFVSCKKADSTENSIGAANTQGVFEPASGWRKKELKVCWADEAFGNKAIPSFFKWLKEGKALNFSAEEKNLIQSALAESFDGKKSAFVFNGFQNCEPFNSEKYNASQINVVLIRGNSVSNFTSSVGQAKLSEDKFVKNEKDVTMSIVVSFDDVCEIATDLKVCKKAVFLHEVGHLLGLRHEDIHPDSKFDSMCQVDFKFGEPNDIGIIALNGNPLAERMDKSTQASKYDKQSIMNRCHLFAHIRGDKRSEMKEIKFSDGDYAAIASIK